MRQKFYSPLIYPVLLALVLPGLSFAQISRDSAAHPALSFGQPRAGKDWQLLPKETLAADSRYNFDQGNRLLHAAGSPIDTQAAAEGLEKLGASGHLIILDVGTQVKNIGVGSQVRVLAGPHAAQIWWLINDTDVRKPQDVPQGAVVDE